MNRLITVKMNVDIDSIADLNLLDDLSESEMKRVTELFKNLDPITCIFTVDYIALDINPIALNDNMIIQNSALVITNGYAPQEVI